MLYVEKYSSRIQAIIIPSILLKHIYVHQSLIFMQGTQS